MTSPFEPSVAQQTALVDHLVKAVVSDATGAAQGDFCLGEHSLLSFSDSGVEGRTEIYFGS